GLGGVGKTQLALMVAKEAAADYPDAQLFVDMRGMSNARQTVADALAFCIRSFEGLEVSLPESIKDLSSRYWSNLAGKRALVMLDNVWGGASIAPMVPPEGCALLVTSRRKIALVGQFISLEGLRPDEARDLIIEIANRVNPDQATRISELCGYLPLALRAA